MKRSVWLVLALLFPGLAFAASGPVEVSMVITGTITVNPDGSVQRYTLYKQDELPPSVQRIVRRTVPTWRFFPLRSQDKLGLAETGMSLRIVADFASVHAKQATVRVAGAEFGCDARATSQLPGECPTGTAVTSDRKAPPRYPYDALRAGVGGEVFLVLEVGRNGEVMHAAARQVNLYARTNDQTYYRNLLEGASLRAARRWRYHAPTLGPEAAKDHWIVEVPVKFVMYGSYAYAHKHEYGQWDVYLPGPVKQVPWSDEGTFGDGHGSADAIASGGAPFMRDPRFVLKSPLATEGRHS